MSLVFLNPADIHISEDRQRQDFDDTSIKDLAASIDKLSVLHPIVVAKTGDGWNLIAGERRLRAMKLLIAEGKTVRHGNMPAAFLIPASEYEDLSPEHRFEMELEENIKRKDLTFLEKANAIARLHELLGKVTGEPVTQQQIVAQAKVSPATVAESLMIAKAAKENPAILEKATNAKEAMKAIRKDAEEKHHAELAKKFDTEKAKTPHVLLLGDSRELFLKVPDSSVDHIFFDPPYGKDASNFGDQAGTGHDYQDDPEYVWKELMPALIEESFRVSKPTSSAHLFCSFEGFYSLSDLMQFAGWHVWPRPLIWNKGGNGMLPVPEKGPRYTYECILFAYRADFKIVKQAMPDVLTYAPVKNLLHGAQKPAALYADLLARVALPTNTVLDPCAGSGTIFLAANTLRLKALGFEREEKTFNLALTRINLTVQNEPVDAAPDLEI